MNNGRLILEAGESWGNEPSSVRGGDGSGRDLEDSPGLMSGPAWRAEPSCVFFGTPGKGPEVPSSSDISGIPKAPQGRKLGPLQAMYMYVGSENGHVQPRKSLGPPSPEC